MSTQDQGGMPPRLPPDSPYGGAIRATKEYAAKIRDNPTDCPMFPNINRPNGAAETLCYMILLILAFIVVTCLTLTIYGSSHLE